MYVYIGFTQAKAEEWNFPAAEESLVRQANNKCYQHRRQTVKNI